MNKGLILPTVLATGFMLLPSSAVLRAEGPRAAEVLARHFTALGGTSKLEKIQTMVVKAEGRERQDVFDFTLKIKRPGKILAEASNARIRVLQGRDPRAQCWRLGPEGLQDMTGASASEFMDLALVFFGASQLFWNEVLTEAVCQ
ncbi:MAG TPA: hypothetical protein P5186_23295 [Candidatus Paceibacterota bacterium]|nr:hypothetical protein [Verrucomicrobiota bacterium]HRY50984.1 hypothetical protein [Candidatus Paceibacterota bacterium]HSA01467.1 hypothetical protein [Candidatus Paceibacterota bacterium]